MRYIFDRHAGWLPDDSGSFFEVTGEPVSISDTLYDAGYSKAPQAIYGEPVHGTALHVHGINSNPEHAIPPFRFFIFTSVGQRYYEVLCRDLPDLLAFLSYMAPNLATPTWAVWTEDDIEEGTIVDVARQGEPAADAITDVDEFLSTFRSPGAAEEDPDEPDDA